MQDVFTTVLTSIYQDCVVKCDVRFDQRDINTLSRRGASEGKSFFTITLPTLNAGLLLAIERGYVVPTDFPFFRKSGKCPSFLKVFFALIFDAQGQLLSDPSVDAIFSIRQMSVTFKKLKEITDGEKVKKSLQRFKEVEHEVSLFNGVPEEYAQSYNFVCQNLWCLLDTIDPITLIPRHGPGATVEKVHGIYKYHEISSRWPLRLQPYFPYDYFCVGSTQNIDDDEKFIRFHHHEIAQQEERPVKVIAVPKTATSSRIIAIEPTAMQYTQQAVSAWVVDKLQTMKLTKGHINFTDQSINQQLALSSSLTREFATLDLSDASDRVSCRLVEETFKISPFFLEVILACRSTKAYLKDLDQTIDLTKYASMGSALCFPIESMVFYSIAVAAQLSQCKGPSYADLVRICSRSYVYGDDIVVPVESASVVSNALTAFGCKVNVGKSFAKSYFRESCGVDAYKGYNITPVYVRQHPPKKPHDLKVLSWQETANQFYKNGLWLTATTIDKMVEKLIGYVPVSERDGAGVHRWSFSGIPKHYGLEAKRVKWNADLQTYRYKIKMVRSRKKKQDPSVNAFLLDFFIKKAHQNWSWIDRIIPSCHVQGQNEESNWNTLVVRGHETLKDRWV